MDIKKKRKNYFSNQGSDFKKRKHLTLESGMKGFLCTCNFREKDCVREAYNILNEYADKVYGIDTKQIADINNSMEVTSVQNNEDNKVEPNEIPIKKEEAKQNENERSKDKYEENKEENKVNEDENVESEDEDISATLNKELDELKAEALQSPLQKKFQVVDTGVSNVVFIKTTVSDTLKLSTAIIEDIHKNKKQKSRYLLRMLPVQVVCKAYLDDIKSKAEVLFEKYFAQEPKTFSIVFNRHSNSNLNRLDVIEDLAQIISKKNPGNKVNLKNPDIAVVIEVVRAVCLISIAPQYFTYKKYNLIEISNQK
ncbi:THUMP domain-containing protein 1 homolog [Phymastichus coffea]|uniref:THUMP domain-containing protein 1 homolog n=1 Tax=Phymastichus coffea TaxID=108790 RepID=UPI00273C0A04|nr:THUMP domain-containing protein 1 homolog [Phymastichus coffea]